MLKKLNIRIVAPVVAAALLAFAVPTPAHAVSKEIVELQTQVQQLIDMVQRLQSTVDTRFGVEQHLVEQSTDNVNRMSQAVSELQQQLATQNASGGGKLDTLSSQVQSVNDSVDELKSRIAKLDKELQDLQAQIQSAQQQMQQPQQTAPQTAPQGATQPDAGAPGGNGNAAPPPPQAMAAPQSQAPPLQDTYQAARRDLNAGKYEVATSEFQDVIHYYPQDDLAGNAQFYLGEIAYQQGKYEDAVKLYNAVLENFSGSRVAPAAMLHKANALMKESRRSQAIDEYRTLIRRYPQAPEASQARSRLNGMGVRIVPRRG